MNSQVSRRSFLAGALATGAGAALANTKMLRAEEPTKAFRYCLNTSTISGQKLTLVENIEITAKAGYTAIEPWTREIDLYVKGGGNLKDLGKMIADKGITVDSVIAFWEWCADDDAKRAAALEKAKKEMEMCLQIGAKSMAAPPVGATNAEVPLEKCTERYKALCELGEKTGVRAELEMWGFSKTLNKATDVFTVAKDCGHPQACVLLDVFHMYKGNNDYSVLKDLDCSKITCFHMNDFPADPPRDQANDGHRIYPGDGVAPLTQVFKDLKATGFKGVLSLELFNKVEWKRDALTVAKIGLEKMQTAVQKALA